MPSQLANENELREVPLVMVIESTVTSSFIFIVILPLLFIFVITEEVAGASFTVSFVNSIFVAEEFLSLFGSLKIVSSEYVASPKAEISIVAFASPFASVVAQLSM